MVTSGFPVQEQKEDARGCCPCSVSLLPGGCVSVFVTVCPASVAGRLQELVSVCLCVCVSLHRCSCHYPHLQATEVETQLLIAGPRVLCVFWDLCHRTKRSLGRRILASLWNQRTSGQERLGNTMAQVLLCRNGGNRMHMTGGQRSCGRGKRAPSQKF